MIALGYLSALFVGLILGLTGGGGSILTVPVLVYLFGIRASEATLYSLFIVGGTSLIGAWSYFRRREIDLKTGGFFLIPSLVGVWCARHLILPAIPLHFSWFGFAFSKDRFILLFFAVVMFSAARSMLVPKKESRSLAKVSPQAIALAGLFAGLLMGLVGAGGGFLIIPVLVGFGRMPMKTAIGTSLALITMSSLFGFLSDVSRAPFLNWNLLISFTALSILGIVVGAKWSQFVSPQKLKFGFGIFVVVVATFLVVKELFG